MKGNALEQANRRAEARAAYEKLAHDFPNSGRARDALLRDATDVDARRAGRRGPLTLKPIAAKDDSGGVILTAKAYEQTGNTTNALASLSPLYFFPPNSSEVGEAPAALARLNSSISAASAKKPWLARKNFSPPNDSAKLTTLTATPSCTFQTAQLRQARLTGQLPRLTRAGIPKRPRR